MKKAALTSCQNGSRFGAMLLCPQGQARFCVSIDNNCCHTATHFIQAAGCLEAIFLWTHAFHASPAFFIHRWKNIAGAIFPRHSKTTFSQLRCILTGKSLFRDGLGLLRWSIDWLDTIDNLLWPSFFTILDPHVPSAPTTVTLLFLFWILRAYHTSRSFLMSNENMSFDTALVQRTT